MKKAGNPASMYVRFDAVLFRLPFAAFAVESRLFRADDREVLGLFVLLEPVEIFLGDGHIRKDRLDRAFRKTRVAVDACVGVDQEFVRQSRETPRRGRQPRSRCIYSRCKARQRYRSYTSYRRSPRYFRVGKSKAQIKTVIPESITCQMRLRQVIECLIQSKRSIKRDMYKEKQ